MVAKDLVKPDRSLNEGFVFIPMLSTIPMAVFGTFFVGASANIAEAGGYLVPGIILLSLAVFIWTVSAVLKLAGWKLYGSTDLRAYNDVIRAREEARSLWARMSELVDPATAVGSAYVLHANGLFGRFAIRDYDRSRSQVGHIDASMLALNSRLLDISDFSGMLDLRRDYYAIIRDLKAKVGEIDAAATRCRQLELSPALQAKLAVRHAFNRARDAQLPVHVRLNPVVERRSLRDMRAHRR